MTPVYTSRLPVMQAAFAHGMKQVSRTFHSKNVVTWGRLLWTESKQNAFI